MQIDGHNTATYVAARLAGFTFADAEKIAYAAQYVDDATNGGIVQFESSPYSASVMALTICACRIDRRTVILVRPTFVGLPLAALVMSGATAPPPRAGQLAGAQPVSAKGLSAHAVDPRPQRSRGHAPAHPNRGGSAALPARSWRRKQLLGHPFMAGATHHAPAHATTAAARGAGPRNNSLQPAVHLQRGSRGARMGVSAGLRENEFSIKGPRR